MKRWKVTKKEKIAMDNFVKAYKKHIKENTPISEIMSFNMNELFACRNCGHWVKKWADGHASHCPRMGMPTAQKCKLFHPSCDCIKPKAPRSYHFKKSSVHLIDYR